MAYSRYFGMRSFENVVRDARFRAPQTGTPIKIGAPVMIDTANAGFLMPAAAATPPGPHCGIAVFEHIQNKSDLLTTEYDPPYDQVPLGQYAQMMHGAGTKVWFRNVGDKVLYDGRTQTGGDLLVAGLDLTTLQLGTGLVPDGAGRYRVAAAANYSATPPDPGEGAWLIVEQVNPSTGRVEARLTF